MAITLDVTGILQAAAFWVSNKGGNNGRKLYFYFYLLLTLISMVVGNDPIILSGTAFLVYYTAATNLEPVAWLISEFAAANTASMVLFVGNPTNVVICEGFRINNAAFTAYTILPFLACSVACYAALSFQFRDSKHVPRRLNVIGKLNVRQVLRDPVSAIFGGVLLITCLVVVIVLSFIHVDVWKVVLPFAVTKFIFDICWDHHRYSTGRIPKFGEKLTDAKADEDPMVSELNRAMSMPNDPERSPTLLSLSAPSDKIPSAETRIPQTESPSQSSATISSVGPTNAPEQSRIFSKQREDFDHLHKRLSAHFPTFFTALPRLPFGLIPFAFSQFILIEALAAQGWINVFAVWLVKASNRQMIPTVWLVGVLGVILCNVSGTNIGATILLTKIVHAAQLPASSEKAAALALAVSSNIGAVSFTFSASLAGLLWKSILNQKGITIKQATFAFWNMLPLFMMTSVGLSVVTAIMVVLY
jgi:Na+/H+ antiporter NhaD/arsenite permease-like protein